MSTVSRVTEAVDRWYALRGQMLELIAVGGRETTVRTAALRELLVAGEHCLAELGAALLDAELRRQRGAVDAYWRGARDALGGSLRPEDLPSEAAGRGGAEGAPERPRVAGAPASSERPEPHGSSPPSSAPGASRRGGRR